METPLAPFPGWLKVDWDFKVDERLASCKLTAEMPVTFKIGFLTFTFRCRISLATNEGVEINTLSATLDTREPLKFPENFEFPRSHAAKQTLLLPFARNFSRWDLLQKKKILDLTKPRASSHLITEVSDYWHVVAEEIIKDPSTMFLLPPRKLEEFVAGALKRHGFEEVVLTPPSGDEGIDVVARRGGMYPQSVAVSVKAHREGKQVGYDDIRALIGALEMSNFTNGQLVTTGILPPRILLDDLIRPYLGQRVQLTTKDGILAWIRSLKQPSGEMPTFTDK